MGAGDLDDRAYLTRIMADIGGLSRTVSANAMISGCVKSASSLQQKTLREGGRTTPALDLIGVRVVLPTTEQCHLVFELLHRHYRHIPEEYDDDVSAPEDNGTRAIHTTLFDPDDRAVEVQIRTHEMHTHAEGGRAAPPRTKRDQGSEPSPPPRPGQVSRSRR